MSLLDRLKRLETKLQEAGTDILVTRQLYDGTGEVEATCGLEGRYTLADLEDMRANREQGLSPKTHHIHVVVKEKRD